MIKSQNKSYKNTGKQTVEKYGGQNATRELRAC